MYTLHYTTVSCLKSLTQGHEHQRAADGNILSKVYTKLKNKNILQWGEIIKVSYC